jgi:hypothetical protein
VFGVLDDDGNAQHQQPISLQVTRFSEDAFVKAQQMIAAERDKAAANIGGFPDTNDMNLGQSQVMPKARKAA